MFSVVGGYTVTLGSGETIDYFTQDTGTLLINSGATLYVAASGGTTTIGSALQLAAGNIYADGGPSGHTVTVLGSGSITATAYTEYIIGNGATNPLTLDINSGGSATADSGAYLYLGYYSGDNVTNNGTITANGGTVYLGGPSGTGGHWHNNGVLTATNNGIIDLGGSFTSADLGGTISATTGGVLDITGTLALTGTLAAPSSGTYTLVGGTISGGTIDGSNGALTFSNSGGTLSNVSVINALTVPASSSFVVTGGTTIAGNVTFGSSDSVYLGQNLTVGSSLTWSDPGYLTVLAFANNATLTNAGTMTLNGGNFYGNGYTGFVVNNSGMITNQTGTLYLDYYAADAVTNSGTINALSTGTNYTLINVGNNSTSAISNSGTIEANVTGTGTAQANVGNGSGTTVTNTGFLTANGANASLYLGYDGTSYASAWSNVGGTITASGGGTVYLGGSFTNTNLTQGHIYGAGGTLDIVGTLTNSATPLLPPNSGTYTLYGGTISGGQVDGSNGALTFSNGGGTLSGVSVINAVTVPAYSSFTVTGGTTLGGNVTFGTSDDVYLGQNLTVGSGLTWSDPGYLTVEANAANYTFTNAGTMTLNGGNIYGGGYTGFLVSNSGTITNQTSSLYLGYYSSDAVTNSGTINALSSGTNYTTVNVGNNSTSAVSNSGTIEANVTGTGSAVAYVGDGVGTSVTNTGFLTANGTNASLYLGYDGTNYTSAWSNIGGTITASGGGAVFLGGAFTNTNLTQGHIYGAGGALDIVGTLTNSATPLLPPNSGTYTLYGGTISGGQVDGSNGALTFSNLGGTLANVAFINTVTVPLNAYFTVQGGTTFAGNLTFGGGNTVYLGQSLTVGPSQAWSDTGSLNVLADVSSLTFTNQGTMTLNGGSIGGYYNTGFVLNNSGSITNAGGTLYLGNYSGDTVTNTGPITAASTSTGYSSVYVGYGTSSATSNSSAIEATTTGNGSSVLGVASGTGTTVANTGTIGAFQTGTGSSTAYVGDASGTTVTNTGLIEAAGSNASLYLGYDGTYYSSNWSNIGGTIAAASGGTVYLGGTFSNATLAGGTINGAGGVLDLVGTLNLTGTLPAPNSGIYTLYGGIVVGGVINGINNALTFSSYGGTLNGVALTGNFTVPTGGEFSVSNGTSFASGTTTFGGGNYVYLDGPTGLTLPAGVAWTDSGSLYVYASANNLTFSNQGVITANGGDIYGDGYTGFVFNNSGTYTNNGYNTLFMGLYSGDSVTNAGTIEQYGSGSIYLQYSGAQLTNLTSSTLTGGTWIASGGGIYFYGTNPINTIAPSTTVVLSGAGSTIQTYSGVGPTFQTIEQTLTTNNGTLEVLANRNYSTANAIVNNGSLQLGGGTFSSTSTLTNGPGSSLSGYGTFSFSGGVTVGSGVAVSPGSPALNSYVGSLSFNSLILGGGGIGTFDIENASGTAGVGYDILGVSGTLAITATPGTPFTLNLESINPGTGLPGAATFNMGQSYSWTLASAASITGFSASDFTLNTSAFTNGLGGGSLSLSSNGTDIFLNFTPVPEPSTWVLVLGGTALLAAASLRRRAARATPVRQA